MRLKIFITFWLWEIINFIPELHLLIQKPEHDDSENVNVQQLKSIVAQQSSPKPEYLLI